MHQIRLNKWALGKVRISTFFRCTKVGPLSQLTLSGQKSSWYIRRRNVSANPLTDDISKQLEIANSVNTIQMSQQGINVPSPKYCKTVLIFHHKKNSQMVLLAI